VGLSRNAACGRRRPKRCATAPSEPANIGPEKVLKVKRPVNDRGDGDYWMSTEPSVVAGTEKETVAEPAL